MASESTNSPAGKEKQSIYRPSLLVVGEDLRDLAVYRLFLERSGCQVFACSSYAQAVRSLQSKAFDFVLLGSLLVALEWGRRATAKVSIARTPAHKRRVSHHLSAQATTRLRQASRPGQETY